MYNAQVHWNCVQSEFSANFQKLSGISQLSNYSPEGLIQIQWSSRCLGQWMTWITWKRQGKWGRSKVHLDHWLVSAMTHARCLQKGRKRRAEGTRIQQPGARNRELSAISLPSIPWQTSLSWIDQIIFINYERSSRWLLPWTLNHVLFLIRKYT